MISPCVYHEHINTKITFNNFAFFSPYHTILHFPRLLTFITLIFIVVIKFFPLNKKRAEIPTRSLYGRKIFEALLNFIKVLQRERKGRKMKCHVNTSSKRENLVEYLV